MRLPACSSPPSGSWHPPTCWSTPPLRGIWLCLVSPLSVAAASLSCGRGGVGEGGSWDEETRDSDLLSPGGRVQWPYLEGTVGEGKRREEERREGKRREGINGPTIQKKNACTDEQQMHNLQLVWQSHIPRFNTHSCHQGRSPHLCCVCTAASCTNSLCSCTSAPPPPGTSLRSTFDSSLVTALGLSVPSISLNMCVHVTSVLSASSSYRGALELLPL